MSSRRPLVLMAILLALVLGYVSRSYWSAPAINPPVNAVAAEPPLPGENSISNLVVRQNESGLWQASFDYFHTGEPRFVLLTVEVPNEKGDPSRGNQWGITRLQHPVERGAHSATADLSYPGSAGITRQVVVKMQDPTRGAAGASILASARVDQSIEWPDWQDWMEGHEFASHTPQRNLERAIALIDGGGGDELVRARSILERLIQRDPSLVHGYIELARVAMKTNWGPEGLHHAEGLLSSALQLQPDYANTKILLGYVYAHQGRYKPAEKLFTEAAASNSKNLWLWANWGEVLAMQGRFDQAIAKYREAIERPMTHDTYDRARADAYTKLLTLLERRKDLEAIEALHQKSVAEFGDSSCFGLNYASFLLQQRGDAAAAIERARKALKINCRGAEGRQIVGLAHYVAWSKGTGAARAESLTQARIYLPAGPMPMYLLARSDKTVNVAAQLVAAGEKIDQRDNDKLNALAYAIQHEDLQAMRRLLRLGAKPDAPVGYGDMPVALMPVMNGNLAMVKLLQQFGADYAKISYQGATAFDFAKQTGDSELAEVLTDEPRTL